LAALPDLVSGKRNDRCAEHAEIIYHKRSEKAQSQSGILAAGQSASPKLARLKTRGGMPEQDSFDCITVVIPTYNREQVLGRAIQGYLSQSSAHLINELIVVDDGSTDRTETVVREASTRSKFPIRYLRQVNRGPAAARNRGLREARSALVLFTDSDIVPAPDLVERHVVSHRRNPELSTALLGYVTWHPEVNASPFMRWYGERMMFHFHKLRHRREVSFHHFYTCNLSVKAEFLRTKGVFDEDFRVAAFEDIELGYRLSKQGLRLLYDPKAIAYHYQFFSFEDACRRELNNSPASEVFFGKACGEEFLREVNRRHSSPTYVAGRRVALLFRDILSPLRCLLNSHFPLPGFVYHVFFWNSATSQTSGKQHLVSTPGVRPPQTL
jgi:glycosyltransferase involved in cell wall biosynthesis